MTEKAYLDKRFSDIDENYKLIKEKIASSAQQSGRNASDIRFMAVTKTVEPVYINHALSLGIDLIGENRVQEYLGKRSELNLNGVEKHLIGHLQTNKVKQIVGEVDMIDGVDSIKLCKEIGKESRKKDIISNILLEINIGDEESKFGFSKFDIMDSLYEISEIEGIKVEGLMAVPPICDNNSKNHTFFSNMRQLFIDIEAKKIDNINMNILSMGMSADYDTAILEGSNMVRVGSALLGARIY